MLTSKKVQPGTKQARAHKKRASKLLKTALAFLVTLLPITLLVSGVLFGLHDPRKVTDLQPITTSQEQIKLFEEPLLSVTFDDGPESAYSQAAPVLEKYGIPTTQYIISGSFNDHNYMSAEQIRSLHAAGHDIQSHTVSHADLVTLDDEDLKHELKQSHDDLSKLLGYGVADFASPLNRYDDRVLNAVQQYYRSHRNTAAEINDLGDYSFNLSPTFDPYNISAFSVRNTTKPEQIQRFIEAAKQKKAWIVLIYHEIKLESTSYYNVTPTDFDAQMKAIKDSNIRVTTIKQTLDAYYNQGAN